MTSSKPISIPLEQNVKLSAYEGDLVEDTTMYICIVGNLIYMTIIKPDLNHVVGVVSQCMQIPQKPHLDVVRHILRYIKHTLQCEIFMKPKIDYKYMDTQMLIRLVMLHIEDQQVVSCFLLEVVLLVRTIRNNQHLHYQTWRHNTKAQ